MRPPTTHENGAVAAFLAGYFNGAEACGEHPWLDDIMTGVVVLKTEGDTGTRPLSRKVLFSLLQRCEVISTVGVGTVLAGRAKARTVDRYAAAARVASKAITARLPTVQVRAGIREARAVVDAEIPFDVTCSQAADRQQPHITATGLNCAPPRLAGQDLQARAMRWERAARLAHLSDRDQLRRTESFP